MKKKLIGILALVLSLSSVAACGSKPAGTSESKTAAPTESAAPQTDKKAEEQGKSEEKEEKKESAKEEKPEEKTGTDKEPEQKTESGGSETTSAAAPDPSEIAGTYTLVTIEGEGIDASAIPELTIVLNEDFTATSSLLDASNKGTWTVKEDGKMELMLGGDPSPMTFEDGKLVLVQDTIRMIFEKK